MLQSQLSPKLRGEVSQFLYRKWITHVPIFRGLEKGFYVDLAGVGSHRLLDLHYCNPAEGPTVQQVK